MTRSSVCKWCGSGIRFCYHCQECGGNRILGIHLDICSKKINKQEDRILKRKAKHPPYTNKSIYPYLCPKCGMGEDIYGHIFVSQDEAAADCSMEPGAIEIRQKRERELREERRIRRMQLEQQ
jgi:hypothetical protein